MKQESLNTKIKKTLKDPNVNGIVRSVTSKFKNCLSQDELEGCALNAVSDALKSYDPSKKSKFTTYLHRGLQIQCLTQVKKNTPIKRGRHPYAKSNIDLSFELKTQIIEVLDELKYTKDGDMVIQKFLMGYTNKEIAQKKGVHPETVRIKIKNTIERLRYKMR